MLEFSFYLSLTERLTNVKFEHLYKNLIQACIAVQCKLYPTHHCVCKHTIFIRKQTMPLPIGEEINPADGKKNLSLFLFLFRIL